MNSIDEQIQTVLHEIAALDPPDDDIAEAANELKTVLLWADVDTMGNVSLGSHRADELHRIARDMFETLCARWPELGWEPYDAWPELTLQCYQDWLDIKRKRNNQPNASGVLLNETLIAISEVAS